MTPHNSREFSAGAALSLLAAIAILFAFFALPWYQLEDGAGAVTGYDIVSGPDEELDLAARATHMFLVVVPLAALAAGATALWELLTGRARRDAAITILLLGVLALAYYYGTFFYESRANDRGATGFVESGFYVALIAALVLIAQALIPRRRDVTTPAVAPAVEAGPSQPVDVPRWRRPFRWLGRQFRRRLGNAPTMAYLFGVWAAMLLERHDGGLFARLVGFRRAPSLFGATEILEPFSDLEFSGILAPFFPAPTDNFERPLSASLDAIGDLARDIWSALFTQGPRDPGFFSLLIDVLTYDLVIFVIPILAIVLLLRQPLNTLLVRSPAWLAALPGKPGLGARRRFSFWVAIVVQLVLLYLALDVWSSENDYRELVLMYIGVNIMLTVSLNLVNGYMGEFSVGHAGFMAVGAYVSAVLTMWLFVDEPVFGDAALSPDLGLPYGFLIALVAGGVAAGIAALIVAVPSFRTRGDYLAIVTLAFNFIVIGVINNIPAVGGPRGLNGVPLWTDLRWVFVMAVLSILAIYSLVSSTFGKGIIAIREDEIAAELMGVNTRRVKLVAFIVSSFIAGVAGGLFAHVLAYVNPGTFGILKSTEVLVMVYLGGMGSISGSVIAAVLFTILIEGLRPLAVLKWVAIPLVLILLMLYRPQGLFGFREIKLNLGGIRPEEPEEELEPSTVAIQEAPDDAAAD